MSRHSWSTTETIGTGVHAGRVIEGYACHVQFLPTGGYVPDDPLWATVGIFATGRGSFRAATRMNVSCLRVSV